MVRLISGKNNFLIQIIVFYGIFFSIPENPREPIEIKDHVDGEVKLILKWNDGKIFDPKIDVIFIFN